MIWFLGFLFFFLVSFEGVKKRFWFCFRLRLYLYWGWFKMDYFFLLCKFLNYDLGWSSWSLVIYFGFTSLLRLLIILLRWFHRQYYLTFLFKGLIFLLFLFQKSKPCWLLSYSLYSLFNLFLLLWLLLDGRGFYWSWSLKLFRMKFVLIIHLGMNHLLLVGVTLLLLDNFRI